MKVPPKSDRRWRQLVTGELKVEMEHLGLKILVSKLKIENMFDGSEASCLVTIDIVYDFFIRNLDALKTDIIAIFGRDGKKGEL